MLESFLILWLHSPLPEITSPREHPGFWELCRRAIGHQPPRLEHLYRFPHVVRVAEVREFQCNHRRWIEAQRDTHLDQQWQSWLNEHNHRELYWEKLWAAQHDYYDVWHRRQQLEWLRTNMTNEQWIVGWMPDPVPLWRFRDG